MLKWNT